MANGAGKAEEGRRVQRFEKEIRAVLANKIIRDFGNTLGFVTVTTVKVTKDLKLARVYISIFGDQVDREASLDALDDYRLEFQSFLGRELKTKYVPKLEFYLDDTFREVDRIGQTLKSLNLQKPNPSSEH